MFLDGFLKSLVSISRRYSLPLLAFASIFVTYVGTQASAQGHEQQPLHDYVIDQFGAPPSVPAGPLAPEIIPALELAFIDAVSQPGWGVDQIVALGEIAKSGDPRLAWPISDLMRFAGDPLLNENLANSASELLGKDLGGSDAWGKVTNHLIAWDIPAPPNYLKYKRAIFVGLVPEWEPLFVEGDIDWRLVSWGGVFIDDRPFEQTDNACNCIPAADNPDVTTAEQATWLDDDDVVFGIALNGEARAYPRQIMEVREMVNDSLGGRDLGIPYCTLCGAAQAYFTDDLPSSIQRPVLRTSGLLSRSNKVMFDLNTFSVFDTFLGHAVTGPLAEIGLTLPQAPVVTTTWGRWKQAYPNTTVLVESLALGRNFDFRNGRDAGGPIFPVGDVNPRLSVHEDVIGIITKSGTPVAFQRSEAILALTRGQSVQFENVELILDAGGVRAIDANTGEALGSHQAFWFAWSQFHENTALWAG